MTDIPLPTDPDKNPGTSAASDPQDTQMSDLIVSLNSRAEQLERKLNEVQTRSDQRIIMAELKTAAVLAGMIDTDGIKLLDISAVKLTADGPLT